VGALLSSHGAKRVLFRCVARVMSVASYPLHVCCLVDLRKVAIFLDSAVDGQHAYSATFHKTQPPRGRCSLAFLFIDAECDCRERCCDASAPPSAPAASIATGPGRRCLLRARRPHRCWICRSSRPARHRRAELMPVWHWGF
jgi:hypothetical protein